MVCAALGLSLLFAAAGHPRASGEDEGKAPTPFEVLTTAVENAKKAAQEDKEAVKALEEAMKLNADRVDDLREQFEAKKVVRGEDSRLSVLWNRAVTALHYHGEKTKHEYLLEYRRIWSKSGLAFGTPHGSTWTVKRGTGSQHVLSIFQREHGGETICHVKIWRYEWDTVYSGVGGENYKKLAKEMHELDRDSMAKKGRKASRRVTAKRLNSEFSRAQYYYVQGFDVDLEATIRRRNYYLKDDSTTYNLELIEYLDPKKSDDAVSGWLRTVEGPERDAFLTSVSSGDD